MSAGLDALDRGVVETGTLAAEALSRVVALEARVHALSRALAAVHVAGGQSLPDGLTPRPYLEAVKP